VVRHPRRNEIIKYMKSKNILLNVSYKWTEKVFSLPIYPSFSIKEQEKVIRLIRRFFKNEKES